MPHCCSCMLWACSQRHTWHGRGPWLSQGGSIELCCQQILLLGSLQPCIHQASIQSALESPALVRSLGAKME